MLRYTRHQVPRGARPDAETHDRLHLIKNVSMLRATYQIRTLVTQAIEKRKKLRIVVPKACKLAPDLQRLRREHPTVIVVERAE